MQAGALQVGRAPVKGSHRSLECVSISGLVLAAIRLDKIANELMMAHPGL